MKTKISNPCIRCGAERIAIKTWTEKIGTSTVTMVQTVCPNPECQKKVDLENKRQSDKRIALNQRNEERMRSKKLPKKESP